MQSEDNGSTYITLENYSGLSKSNFKDHYGHSAFTKAVNLVKSVQAQA